MATNQSESPFFRLPAEVRNAIFVDVFSCEAITVDWDPVIFGKPRARLPQDAINIALTCKQFRDETRGCADTMVCKLDARPSSTLIPAQHRRRIQKIVLEGACGSHLDICAFPAVRTVIWESHMGPVSSAIDLDHMNRSLIDFVVHKDILESQKGKIHGQVEERLPLWMQEAVAAGVGLQLELSLHFARPFEVEKESWNADVTYPALYISMNCRFDWKTGHIFDMVSSF